MFIPTSRPKPKGALVKVDFSTRDGFHILFATCEVVRSDEALPGMLSGMWVSFRVLDETHRALIMKIYQEREDSVHGAKPAEVMVFEEPGSGEATLPPTKSEKS